MNWDGLNVIITGASSGIGEKISFEVAKKGATPIMLARSFEKLKKIAESIQDETGITPFTYKLDVSDEEAVKEVFQHILSDVERIDVLINNAGFAHFDLAHESTMESVKNMFHVNVFGSIVCTQMILSHMMEQRSGHIIYIASQAGKLATPKSSAYSATKHAILGYANSLRMELQGTNINVSVVNPGPVRTSFFATADKSGEYEKSVQRYMLTPERVALKTVELIQKPKREVNLPGWMNIGTKIYQLFPGLVEKLAGSQLRKK
ncbi:SDR family NAD(P)-dependent oxidoreductase [Evansella sp. AB-rgal1]|uniref:SDR family NAD(P)-dependent oxidoreductase n=1 Tax=Evansella sp. AB-rgal1 TaxID=3242696 RepID=UPI00359DDB95